MHIQYTTDMQFLGDSWVSCITHIVMNESLHACVSLLATVRRSVSQVYHRLWSCYVCLLPVDYGHLPLLTRRSTLVNNTNYFFWTVANAMVYKVGLRLLWWRCDGCRTKMWAEQFGTIDTCMFYVFCAVAFVISLLALTAMLAGCCLQDLSWVAAIHAHMYMG